MLQICTIEDVCRVAQFLSFVVSTCPTRQIMLPFCFSLEWARLFHVKAACFHLMRCHRTSVDDPETRRFCIEKFTVRDMFTSHVKLRGAEPSEDIEPTLEQVSAIHQVVTADVCLCGLLTVWSALQETVAQAHFPQLSLGARRLSSGRDCLDHHPLGIGGSLFTVYLATLLLMDAALLRC